MFIVFLLFASFFFFPFPRCAAVVKVYRAGRGGRQPLEVLAGGVVTALAWNWRFLCRVRFLTRVLALRCVGCFFSFYIQVPVDSPCLVDAKDSGATVTCGGGRGFPSALPTGDPLTSLCPPTPGTLPFKLCFPSHLPVPLSGYSKFQGVASEYRLQTKSWRRRK